MTVIDYNGLSLLIFKEKWHNYISESKFAPNSDSFLGASAFQFMRAGFLCSKYDNFAYLHTRQDQNELHLKRWFFFAKIFIFCKSIAGRLPRGVQAYTQSYSFGGSIKLIICQLSHKLSVTIHEISTSWKKTFDGGPYIYRPLMHQNFL